MRWGRRRRDPDATDAVAVFRDTRTFRIHETVQLRHPPEHVWAFVHAAESSVLLLPGVVHAFTVPGTGAGLGEQQAVVDRDGRRTVIEVTEYEEGRRAVAAVISPPPEMPTRSVTALEPLGEGCALTYGVEYDAPLGSVWPKERRDSARAEVLQYLERVKWELDAQSTAPDSPSDR